MEKKIVTDSDLDATLQPKYLAVPVIAVACIGLGKRMKDLQASKSKRKSNQPKNKPKPAFYPSKEVIDTL